MDYTPSVKLVWEKTMRKIPKPIQKPKDYFFKLGVRFNINQNKHQRDRNKRDVNLQLIQNTKCRVH